MPANVEIKARVSDLDQLESIARQLTDDSGTVLEQKDTFFNVPQGRLKLREIKDAEFAQLIYYERSDQSGPKHSDYWITEEHNPDQLKETLGKALGIKGCVNKKRTLYIVGQTRVHLDRVVDLGSFMELEVVLSGDQTTEMGQKIAEDLMSKLKISSGDLITCAYMDLIIQSQNS